MIRYFMTIPEASELVLQAGGLRQNGVVYVLDMGEPVRILDMAKDLIRLSGMEPHIDIPIQITGIRPGEELLTSDESAVATHHKKIHISTQNSLPGQFEKQLENLMNFAIHNNKLGIKKILMEIITVNELKAQGKTVDNKAKVH
jgi:FlaA1/EpsC-like NDP-sugar epimerase